MHDESLEEAAKQQAQVAKHEDRRVRVLSLDGYADVAHLANTALRECTGDFVGFVNQHLPQSDVTTDTKSSSD